MSFIRCFTCRTRASVLLSTLKGLIKPTDSVLDVGCDTGIVTNYIKEKIGCKITGTDFQNILEYNIPFESYYEFDAPLISTNENQKRFDKVLLVDVLHHVQKEEQAKIVKYWEQYGTVIIIETLPNLTAKFVDLLNDFRGMIVPYAFRSLEGWQLLLTNYKVERIKSPTWYPLNHVIMTRKL